MFTFCLKKKQSSGEDHSKDSQEVSKVLLIISVVVYFISVCAGISMNSSAIWKKSKLE